MLTVDNLSVGYKGLLAIQDASFEVKKGEIVSLIGSNGAGKTTMLKTILGLLKPMQGEIRLNGEVISGQPAYEVVKKKIALVPEGATAVPPPVGSRQPHHRGLHRRFGRADRRNAGRDGADVPLAEAALGAARRDTFRRRTAAGGDRPGA